MADNVTPIRVVGMNGAGDEVYENVDKLVEAKSHATAKIREQQEQLRAAQAQLEQYQQWQAQQQAQQQAAAAPDGSGFDRNKYFALLYENPQEAQAYSLKHILGRDIGEFVTEYDQVRQGAMAGYQQSVNGAFVQKHPELLQVTPDADLHNAKVISEILTKRGWAYNVDNLEAAYAVAKVNNQLQLPDAQPSDPAASQQIAAPIVTGKPSAQGSDGSAEEADFLRTAPIGKVRDYLENKFKGASAFAPSTI